MSGTASADRIKPSAPASLWIVSSVLEGMLAHCRGEAPREACGLLGGRGTIATSLYPVANVANRPEVEFSMDPAGQLAAFKAIDARGEEIVAIYHSHPRTSPVPSRLDIERAYYPELFYLIVGLTEKATLRAYRIDRASGRAVGVDWRSGHEKRGV